MFSLEESGRSLKDEVEEQLKNLDEELTRATFFSNIIHPKQRGKKRKDLSA